MPTLPTTSIKDIALNSKLARKKTNIFSSYFVGVGLALITLSLAIVFFTFYPVLKHEVTYQVNKRQATKAEELTPPDSEFSIIVPKISAVSKVIKDVDPFDSAIYQRALTQGVAHAQGTAYPGQGKNIFLFSHSSVDFYEASRYNSIFYLLNKLELGDEITLYYQDEPYTYQVTSTKLVEPDQVEYLSANSGQEQLTLMTCWPPGTTSKRLIIIARPLQS